MARKFSELTQSEQIHFNSLVDFMRESWNEDIRNKLKVVDKFHLDVNDPIVIDFLAGEYTPPAPPSMPIKDDLPPPLKPRPPHENPDLLDPPIPIENFFKKRTETVQEPSLPVVALAQQIEKTTKREMTYANSENLIVFQNRLLHGISHLTLNERRLILFLSPIIRKETYINPNKVEFFINIQQFASAYNLKGNSVYEELRKATISIQEKTITLWDYTQNSKSIVRNVESRLNWVTKTTFFEHDTEILLRLDKEMVEMLTIFDKATGNFWTQYQKEWIVNLGAYGIIMLEMILSSKETSGYYTIEHLREKFDCVESYKKFSDFKLYVIDKSIKEVEQHTPIRITYEINKIGKNVKGIKFSYIDSSVQSLENKEKNIDDLIDSIFSELSEDEKNVIKAEADHRIALIETKNREPITADHRLNIYKKSVAERWGWLEHLSKQARQQKDEEKRLLTEKVEQAEMEKIQQAQSHMRDQIEVIEMALNSISEEDKLAILELVRNEVSNNMSSIFVSIFDKDKENAYKNPMFLVHFNKVLGL